MDQQQLATMAAQIVAVLTPATPILTEAAKSMGSAIGKEALPVAKRLFHSISERFSHDKNSEANTTLDLFSRNPLTFESALADLLLQTLAQHPDWAQEVYSILNDSTLQEVIARNGSHIAQVSQRLRGMGTQRIEADEQSKITDVEQNIDTN